MAKEFQGRSCDMMVAHTTIVFTRYLLLAVESRESQDPRTLGHLFYVCCDELEDIKFASAMLLLIELFKSAIQEVLVLSEEKFQQLFDKFLSTLPNPVKGLFGVSVWESWVNEIQSEAMEKSKATYITTPLDTKAQDIWNKSIDEAIEENKDPKAAIQQIADDIERAVKADKDMLKADYGIK